MYKLIIVFGAILKVGEVRENLAQMGLDIEGVQRLVEGLVCMLTLINILFEIPSECFDRTAI